MSGKLLLNSWKEIAEFVGRTERTVQRWEKLYGLPVHRPAGRERSAVIALASEIEAWSARTSARGMPVIASARRQVMPFAHRRGLLLRCSVLTLMRRGSRRVSSCWNSAVIVCSRHPMRGRP